MKKKEITFSLKDQLFNKNKIEYLAWCIKWVYENFNDIEFILEVVDKFSELELKERITHITNMLKKYLPDDYDEAIKILLDSLPDEVITDIEDNNFWDFIFSPYSEYVSTFWCSRGYLELSLYALENMTTRFSAEDSIRSFINAFEVETFEKILWWSRSDNYHLRRLASEWTRPKLPWCKKINSDYRKTIPILNNLYTDSSRFVTRSVANHLNDIAKIEPKLVIETLSRWKKLRNSNDLNYIISHWTRTLVKIWNKETFEFLWYSYTPQITIKDLNIKNSKINIWENLEFDFEILGNKSEKLIIDYKIYFIWKNWKLRPKVFKIKKLNFTKWIKIIKKHPLKLMTTKALYSWEHFLEIIINWNSYWKIEFILL